jgi:hypothetical protein
MHWIECTNHPSVYFDSSIHKNCPECQNEILREIAKLYSEIIDKDDEHDLAVLDYIQTYLASLQYANEGKWHEEKKRNFTITTDSKAEELKKMRMVIRNERSKVSDLLDSVSLAQERLSADKLRKIEA